MKIFKYTFLLFTALCLLLSGSVYAQNRIVRGTITDKADGQPLAAANVLVKNAAGRNFGGAAANIDGEFAVSITIPDAVLSVSYLGYKTLTIPVGTQSEFKIVMEAESMDLGVLTFTEAAVARIDDGYVRIDRRNLATSTTMVKIDEIAKSSATSVAEMMQGRAAGVQIVASSGDPGAAFSIKIRGNSSINASNDPLIVIDNVPTELSMKGANISDLMSSSSPLQDLNPEDIESINILKDAGSTAIYGSRGANGVVVITTKRGRKNETSISYGNQTSVQFSPKEVPLLSGDDQKIFILEGEQNRGNGMSGNISSINYLASLRDDPYDPNYHNYNNNTDWTDLVTQTGYTFKNDFSLRGGGNTTRYFFSVSSTTQTGTTKGSGYDRLTSQFNLDYQISNKLQFRSNIGYTRSVTERDGSVHTTENETSPLGMARSYPAFLPVYEKDINGNNMDNYFIPIPDIENNIFNRHTYNPVAWIDYTDREATSNRFSTLIEVMYDPLPGFRITSRVSVDFNNQTEHEFIPAAATNRLWNDLNVNRTRYESSNSQNIQQENVVSYQKTFNEIHELTLTGISKLRWNSSHKMFQMAANTANSNLEGTGTASRWLDLSASENKDAGVSFVGQMHYMLLDRYILAGTVNTEGSSKFGPGNRWAYFPTASFGWRLSKEPFMESFTFLDDFKLRYSIGQAGNAPGDPYLFYNLYGSGSYYLDKPGINSNNIQLNTLQWETSITHNYGLDAALFNNRWTFSFDAYYKKTEDLLMKRSLPGTSGFGEYLTNFGTLRNKGLEFETQVRVIEKEVRWNVGFNIASNANKILYLPDDRGYIGRNEDGYNAQIREGDPIGSFYGYRYKGVYATDNDAIARDKQGNLIYDLNGRPKIMSMGGRYMQGGDAIYEDLNHDGIINDQDITIIGDSNPDFFGGITSDVSYKSWRLSVFLEYKSGNDVLNIARKELEAMGGGVNANRNQAQSVMRRWRKQGDITDMPRVTFEHGNNNAGSDRFAEDASYLRLKTVSLNYDIPKDFCKKVGIRTASAYVTGYNLLTFTGYTGQDPEISLNGSDAWAVGKDKNRTAVPKSFTVGLQITFN